MRDNIMFIPAIVVLLACAASLIFLICAWIKAKRRVADED